MRARPLSLIAAWHTPYWVACGAMRKVSMSPTAQALAWARIASISCSSTSSVRLKQLRSSSPVRWNSRIAALGSSSLAVATTEVTFRPARLARVCTRSATTLSVLSAASLIAALYSSSAAKIGRRCSTLRSRPR